MAEPFTLYKLIVLYMLDKVDFPLTNAQISDNTRSSVILDKGYTTYFKLQQALSELAQSGFIREEATHSRTFYHLTEEGGGDDPLLQRQDLRGHPRGHRRIPQREALRAEERGRCESRLFPGNRRGVCGPLPGDRGRPAPHRSGPHGPPPRRRRRPSPTTGTKKNQEVYALIMQNLL